MYLIFSFASIQHFKENMSLHEVEIDDEHCCGNHFWVLALLCWVFMFFAAISSALALGLLSFSQVDLEVLVKAGQPHIQKNAGIYMSLLAFLHCQKIYVTVFLFQWHIYKGEQIYKDVRSSKVT